MLPAPPPSTSADLAANRSASALSASIKAFFTDVDDQVFLLQMFAQFPKIAPQFEKYLAMPAHDRFEAALEELDTLPRTGWVNRRMPNPETVYDHTMRLAKQARDIAEVSNGKLDPDHLEALAHAHDLPEAIVGDFPPGVITDKADKRRFESLAARVLFEGDSKNMQLYEEYENKKTLSAQLLNDLDKIDPCRMALMYQAHCPELGTIFDDFCTETRKKLKTDFGREALDELIKNANTIRENLGKHLANFPRESRDPVTIKPSSLTIVSERNGSVR